MSNVTVQSVRNVRAICLHRSLSATLTASKRTEPVTGDSTLLTGQPTSRWDIQVGFLCNQCQWIPSSSQLSWDLVENQLTDVRVFNINTNTFNIWLQVFEDYSEEEQEKYKEELETIKKRFSHTKLKRKWVSFSRFFVDCETFTIEVKNLSLSCSLSSPVQITKGVWFLRHKAVNWLQTYS